MKKILLRNVPGLIFLAAVLSGCSMIQYVSNPPGVVDHETAKQILKPLNEARIRGMTCGNVYFGPAEPVRWNEKLARASLDHSLDMAKNGFMSHKGSDGNSADARLATAGYSWSGYGENIGQGYGTAGEAVNAWLKSEKHCRNIMNPDFEEAGAASAKNKNLRTFWTLVLGTPAK
jgi:uncharacterized protein YkwD